MTKELFWFPTMILYSKNSTQIRHEFSLKKFFLLQRKKHVLHLLRDDVKEKDVDNLLLFLQSLHEKAMEESLVYLDIIKEVMKCVLHSDQVEKGKKHESFEKFVLPQLSVWLKEGSSDMKQGLIIRECIDCYSERLLLLNHKNEQTQEII